MSAERNLNDTELLSAYLDGQLTIDERSALEARLQTDATLRHQLALLRATVHLIREMPQLSAPRDFTLTRQMVKYKDNTRRIYTFSLLSAAAAVVLLFVGFGLLTVRMQGTMGSSFSQVVNNLEADGDRAQVAVVPTDTALSTQPPPTSSTEPGFFAQEEQTMRGADLESENAGEQAQPTPSILSQIFRTSTAPAPALEVAPPLAQADDAQDDSTTSTTEEETAEDGRLRDTQQAQSFAESPASALPSDAMVQPSQEGAGGMLAMQPTVALPTSTPQPTLLPTRTSLPTETASHTPSFTPTQTNTATATITPTPPPPEPTVTAEPTVILALVLIVAAVVLLVGAITAVIINRRR